MSNAVFIFSRHRSPLVHDPQTIAAISARLQPDNIQYPQPAVYSEPGLLSAVINPCTSLPIIDASICLGGFFGEHHGWQEIGSPKPDGSYSLYRYRENEIEVLTDALGTRSIWYFFDDERFIASSSQRAIVALLGSYQPDISNYPWMMSSGRLNFMHAWDKRIQRLPLDSRITLSRSNWQVNIETTPYSFKTSDRSDADHEKNLAEVIRDTLQSHHVDLDSWLVPLSGGCDSRTILLGLVDQGQLNTITWGVSKAKNNTRSDVSVAQQLSDKFDTRHRFYELDSANRIRDIESVLDRFVKNSEGQLDNLSGYMDGFTVWKRIFESEYEGVFRGDEALTDTDLSPDWASAYLGWDMLTLDEITNLKKLTAVIDAMPQTRDPVLATTGGESMVEFSDRIFGIYYIAMTTAPLTSMKTAYCEILNPLLSRNINTTHQELPEYLKKNKLLFKKILRQQLPDIDFAKNNAIESKVGIVNSDIVSEYVLNYLRNNLDNNILPWGVLEELLNFVEQNSNPRKATRLTELMGRVGNRIRRFLRIHNFELDPMLLGFRIFIILRMHAILTVDAQILRQVPSTEFEH